jgi:cytochrome c oxidase subunit II
MVIFAWGAVVYFKERTPPADATEVYVVAKQWMWKVEHAEGQREINELHVPVGRDVKLIMTSQDVIHSFYIPAFRIKQDVLPGRYTVEWFRATKPGVYHLFCAEYCGTQHSGMVGSIVVLEPAQYQAWMNGGSTGPLSATERKFSPNSAALPAIAPTCRDAARTCREFSASRCSSKTAAPSPPTKITCANAFSIRERSG